MSCRTRSPGYPGAYGFPTDGNNVAPRLAVAWDPTGNEQTSVHGVLRHLLRQPHHVDVGHRGRHQRRHDRRAGRSWRARRRRSAHGRSRASSCRRRPSPPFPSLEISIDPGLEDARTRITASIGINRELRGDIRLSADYVNVRGYNQVGTIDYNPVVHVARHGPSSGRRQRRGGHLGVDSPVHVVGRDLVRRPHAVAEQALQRPASVPGELHAVEGRGQVDRLPERVRSAEQRAGTKRCRCPRGCRSDSAHPTRRGSSLQDQRHRFVLSGLYDRRRRPCRCRRSSRSASGRPYNILAGTDLNGDGDGGAFPPDRARRDPDDAGVQRRAQCGHDALSARAVDVRVVARVRNRQQGQASRDSSRSSTCSTGPTTPRSTTSSGRARIRPVPLPTYGQFTQAAPPRQAQLAFKLTF